MTGWQPYWLAWRVVFFGTPETYALFTNTQHRLSWTIWAWFGVRQGVPVWQRSVMHLLLLAVLVRLLGHLTFGIWR
ncbi:hypothetical protein AB5J72_07445 [Streptomyces sp. CG1]|uniref:hypothetical protein n=1 Tax=Streptomyces sp. CG1 TaxID=1287523 RepID=UPI0034E21F63